MDTINKEKLILSLIKDDLINTSLIRKLEKIGLYSDCYYLHLSSTIFGLMGIERIDEMYDLYIELSEKAVSINIIESNESMDSLALEIYEVLTSKVNSLKIV